MSGNATGSGLLGGFGGAGSGGRARRGARRASMIDGLRMSSCTVTYRARLSAALHGAHNIAPGIVDLPQIVQFIRPFRASGRACANPGQAVVQPQ
jgi:hypothetical protein